MKNVNKRKRRHKATQNQIQSFIEAKQLGIIKNQEQFLVLTLKRLRRPVSRLQLEKITKIRCSSLTRALADLRKANVIGVANVKRCNTTGMPVQFYSLSQKSKS